MERTTFEEKLKELFDKYGGFSCREVYLLWDNIDQDFVVYTKNIQESDYDSCKSCTSRDVVCFYHREASHAIQMATEFQAVSNFLEKPCPIEVVSVNTKGKIYVRQDIQGN